MGRRLGGKQYLEKDLLASLVVGSNPSHELLWEVARGQQSGFSLASAGTHRKYSEP